MITNVDEYKPHEVICIHCMNRWISVHEQGEWLAKCGKVGGIIYRTTIIIFLFCPEVLTTLFMNVILYTKERKCTTLKKRIYYDTYISIIRNNEPISFIPFRGEVSDKEIKEELTTEFTDLDIPLNLVHNCMYDGMLKYEDIYVYIIDVN